MATQTTFVYGSTSSVRICGDVDSCSLDVLLDADCDDVCGDEDNCPHGAANDLDGDNVCSNDELCAQHDTGCALPCTAADCRRGVHTACDDVGADLRIDAATTPTTTRASGDDVEIDVRALRTNGDGESAPSPGFANNDLVRADEPLCLFAASTSTTNDLAVRVTCCLRHRRRVRPCVWRRRPDLRARWA